MTPRLSLTQSARECRIRAARLCDESERLQSRSLLLRAENAERHDACLVAVVRSRRTRGATYRSTWSDLPWQPLDPELNSLLAAVEGDR